LSAHFKNDSNHFKNDSNQRSFSTKKTAVKGALTGSEGGDGGQAFQHGQPGRLVVFFFW
jgi:hypothetical protein